MIPAVLIALAAAVSCAGKTVVSAPTGPPELLVLGFSPIPSMDRQGYDRAIDRLAPRGDLVPVREWPAELPTDAPVFLTELGGRMVTLAIRGDESSGFELLVDGDANGKLDEPAIPFKKGDDGWIVTFRVEPAAASTGGDRRAATLVEARWEQRSFRDQAERIWCLKVCRLNVRRGVVDLAGRQTAFAITGETGAYGRDPLEVFFDLDGDGRLALDAPYGSERFTVKEGRVVVGHTAYRFVVDPAGDSITVTRLAGWFEPRADLDVGARAPEFTLTDLEGHPRRLSDYRGSVVLLDFWNIGCVPCISEMPKLAAMRTQYRDRGFEILGIHVGPQVPDIATTCASKGATWPELVDDGTYAVSGRYRVERSPTTFLIDRKGRIVDRGSRGETLEAAVAKTLDR